MGKRIMKYARVKPHVLQNHFNIYMPGHYKLSQKNVFPLVRKHNMAFLSRRLLTYSDLTSLRPLEDPHVKALAAHHKKTPAQVLLRWSLQQGVGVVMKAEHPQHIKSNTQIHDFHLPDKHLAYLNQIGKLNHPDGNAWFNQAVYDHEEESEMRADEARDNESELEVGNAEDETQRGDRHSKDSERRSGDDTKFEEGLDSVQGESLLDHE